MSKGNHSEHTVFYNTGGQINYANHGSTIHVSNTQTDELRQLIQQLRQAMADTDRISETEKEETYELLENVRQGGPGHKSLANLLLERLEKWQGVFGATSAVGQVIALVMDAIK